MQSLLIVTVMKSPDCCGGGNLILTIILKQNIPVCHQSDFHRCDCNLSLPSKQYQSGINHNQISAITQTEMEDYVFTANEERKLKLIIVGDSSVGKSSLFLKFVEDDFDTGQKSTIAIDFKMKAIKFKGESIKLYIWDTAGQERFRSVVETYFKGCHGMLLVFDQTDPNSFTNLRNKWYPICSEKSGGAKMVLVGNKSDLPKEVNKEEVKRWAESEGLKYYSTSAKSGNNVEEAFLELVKLNMEMPRKQKDLVSRRSVTLVKEKKEQKKKNCC